MPDTQDMIRKTRLMSKSGVMLVRVETFQGGILRSTLFRLSIATDVRTFTRIDQALDAFRALIQPPTEKARLKTAA